MALTAREWILLPQKEMEARKCELSKKECAKLRLELDMIHFTEEEKENMPQDKREAFLHPKEYTEEEKKAFNQKCQEIFRKMQEDAENRKKSTSQ